MRRQPSRQWRSRRLLRLPGRGLSVNRECERPSEAGSSRSGRDYRVDLIQGHKPRRQPGESGPSTARAKVIAGSVAVARAGLAGSAAQAGTPPFTAPSPDAYTEMVPPAMALPAAKRRAIGVHHGQNGGCRRLYVHIHRVAHVAAVRNATEALRAVCRRALETR